MGHFCRICGRIRANERFSGKGRRRLVRLRRERDFVHRLMTELPPGIWEGYVNRFGDFLEDPYELLPGFDPMAESLPPASDGVATSSLPFEPLCQGDEDIATPLLFSMGAVSNFAPEDPGPDPEPDEPICWEACEPIQPPFDDW